MNYQMEPKPQVGFVEAGKLYLKKATDFKSRSRRSEYWMACLFLFFVNLVGSFVLGFLSGLLGEAGALIAAIVYLVWGIFCMIASLALCIRRLHDTGKSGWYLLMGLIPLAGPIIMLVFYCMDSTEDNKWGPNPKYYSLNPEPAARPAAVPVQRDYEDYTPGIPAMSPVSHEPVDLYEKPTAYTPTESARSTRQASASVMEAEPAVYGSLYLYSGPMAGQIFRFPEGRTVTIGRSNSRCDVVLAPYNVVSGVHCKITICRNYINITDLNSTNGTFVNGIRLTPNKTVSARNGATIYLANATCAFQVRFE